MQPCSTSLLAQPHVAAITISANVGRLRALQWSHQSSTDAATGSTIDSRSTFQATVWCRIPACYQASVEGLAQGCGTPVAPPSHIHN